MPVPVVAFKAVTRTFGDLVAVDGVSLDIHPGEVLGILGENGAGKSTLMKMLFGIYPPTKGEILIDGVPSAITGPSHAMSCGIGMVFQHFSQLPALSVRDNLLLAWPRTPFWTSRRNRGTDAVLKRLKQMAPRVDPERAVGTLSVGEQQIVELCKVLNISARLIILDEPTSVLTPAEARQLHGFIRQLAREGAAVVLITHKLADIEACADRVAVMRKGAVVDVSRKGERTLPDIVSSMMGKTVQRAMSPPPAPGRAVPRLVLQDVCADGRGVSLKNVSLSIGKGEILGVAGVAGNGQTLLAECVAGVHPIVSGEVLLDGVRCARRRPADRLATPLGYIPEQPRENATVEGMSLAANLALRELAAGRPANLDAAGLLARFNVNPPDPVRPAGTLSGGNLQKLVSARELGVRRDAVLACYPTMGLDLAAIETIYAELFAQARAGAAILWISEDIDDLLTAAHRIAVLREGRIVAVSNNDGTLTRDRIGGLMAGYGEHAA